MLLKLLIIFLIRRRLKLRVGDFFIFNNQKTHSVYWFSEYRLMKMEGGTIRQATVSLNWLLSDNCSITNFGNSMDSAVLAGIEKEGLYAKSQIHSR